MRRAGTPTPPVTVTAEYSVKLRRPTPTDGPIELVARPVEVKDDRAIVDAELRAGGKLCATFRGTFVAVKPGHPAYHRW
jgi:acyl-coenzyme A thioesterase PaaI-like protein